jgi:hypothetical protein
MYRRQPESISAREQHARLVTLSTCPKPHDYENARFQVPSEEGQQLQQQQWQQQAAEPLAGRAPQHQPMQCIHHVTE